MVDQVARALCDAAGRTANDATDLPPANLTHRQFHSHCIMCREEGGVRICTMWESFREEARAAIGAAFQWHKKERRWPSFCAVPQHKDQQG